METTLTIPTADELRRRIEAARQEVAALKRLHRLAQAAELRKARVSSELQGASR